LQTTGKEIPPEHQEELPHCESCSAVELSPPDCGGVLQLQFLINEGALVSASSDDMLHLWNLRQKRPAILHSLKFNRERITFCHLPFQSKWLYVGTERGNTHIVNIESFVLSGYVIMWNKAIELSTKTHPGPVVHLSDSPRDEGKYSFIRHFYFWKQFICSHSDGSLTFWNLKSPSRPFQIIVPHGKMHKVVLIPFTASESIDHEPFIIFSGGLSYDKPWRRPSLTIMHGKAITVLEMDHPIVDFLTLCETPYPNEIQEPYAVVILLEKDLIVVDLTQSHYPIFENPYPMDIHESPVTCTQYFADCPPDLIPVLYSVGAKHKKQGYSSKEWPVSGGAWNLVTLQMLYKLKTSKVFEKQKLEGKPTAEMAEEDPFAIQLMYWCPESRIFCIAGASAYVIVYRFSKHEVNPEISCLEVQLQSEIEDNISPEAEMIPPFPNASSHLSSLKDLSGSTNTVASEGIVKDSIPCLSVKARPVRMPPGYQAELVIQLVWADGEAPQQITSLTANSAYGVVAFGNCSNLVVVDFIQKTVLLSMGSFELYGSSDLFQRQPRSPRRSKQFAAGLTELSDGPISLELERCKSPTASDNRENSISHSRSSSVSSIDKETKETITALYFTESFARKNDTTASPCLWVGTGLGVVLTVSINLPSTDELRQAEPVTASPSGTFLSLKGAVLTFACLDCSGTLIHPPYEAWRDPNSMEESERTKKRKLVLHSSCSQDTGDHQFAIICSEKQAKVFSLPSQTCLYVHNVTDTSFLLRADVVTLCNSACLACFCASGRIIVHSLPSLRPLLDVNYLPVTDMRIARTFCFTNEGQALYLGSPTEIQRLNYSQEMFDNLQDMLGELFTPVETPEAQYRGFLKGLFGGTGGTLDREELFGEATAGKASRSLAQHIPGSGGVEGMKGAAGGVIGDLARARLALDERGQKLGELDEKTARMMTSAEAFSKHAHEVSVGSRQETEHV
uniref:V-SNARE coiled-coil homology domain-containing protein n=1 Tax=Anolis carolinensis TaxID=28377 RepID=A0A803T754_ANOCA